MVGQISNDAFTPEVGKCYHISFGHIQYQNIEGQWGARIRVEGTKSQNWIDLDTGKPLDPMLANYVVQAHIEIVCS